MHWLKLTVTDLDPKHWGWKLADTNTDSVLTDLDAAPERGLCSAKANFLPEIHADITDAPVVKLD